ncbi:MAG: hypothetical protein JHD16_19135, partial [Solirubrobacteraceae bacterium]|nr:hypothetical protein [Solirubrobacteraceae bacterium]
MSRLDGPLRTALRRRPLRQATLGFAAITLGEWVLGTVVAIELFDRGGALAVGAVGARFVPAAFASVLLSTLADRWRASHVLSGIGAARAVVTAAVMVALSAGAPVAVIVGLVWLDAAIGAGYRPAQARLLPSVARTPQELTAAVTLISTAKSGGQILGALAGSGLLLLVGAPGAVAGACALFGLAAVASRAVRTGPVSVSLTVRRSAGRRLIDGLEAVASSTGASRVSAWSCARSLLRGVWTSLGVLAALTLLHLGDGGYGVLMAAAGVGTFLGVAISTQLVGRRHLAAPFAAALGVAGAAVAGVGLTAWPLAAVAMMIGWGAGMAVADVAAQSLLARVVAPSDSARVVGSMEGLKLLAEGLGALAAPLAAEVVGLREALSGAGLLLVLALLADLRGFAALDRVARGRVELLELAHGVPLFGHLRVDGLESLVAPMVPVSVRAGDELITQDALGSQWYLVRSGQFGVEVDGFRTGTVGRGGAFG